MSTIKIKPLVGFGATVDTVELFNNIRVDTDAGAAHATCVLRGSGVDIRLEVVIDGEAYDNWSTDDNYIVDAILTKLGAERAPKPVEAIGETLKPE